MAKNLMKLTNEDNWNGYSIENIKEWSKGWIGMNKEEKADVQRWKDMKKEISAYNKLATQLHKFNPGITSFWDKHKDSYNGAFILRIQAQIKSGFYTLEDVGKIDAHDNGSRGLGRTLHMQLKNPDNRIIDVAECGDRDYLV